MRPAVVMLCGFGLLYVIYTGRLQNVLDAISQGGSSTSGSGGNSSGAGGQGGADGGGGFNGSNQSADTTAPVKGWKSLPTSQRCPRGYKWDSSRETCVRS